MRPEDEISQAERRRIMSEQRRMQTYSGHALDGEPELGGRFKKVNTTTVTGTGPGPSYPRIPSGPWAKNEMPDEPPLGYSVEEHEPTGELHEQRASTGTVEGGPVARNDPSHVITAATGPKFKRRA